MPVCQNWQTGIYFTTKVQKLSSIHHLKFCKTNKIFPWQYKKCRSYLPLSSVKFMEYPPPPNQSQDFLLRASPCFP